MMYKISEFSQIAKITVKALRYYDQEGILVPSHRDEANSYRYYDNIDFRKAQLIILLRDLAFSIAEIKDVLSCYESEADLSFYLEEKRNQIRNNMEKERALIEKINSHIHPQKTEENILDYHVETKNYASILVASIRFKGSYGDIGKYIGTISKAIRGNAAGSPFSLSYDTEYKDEADIEVCVPIDREIGVNDVTIKTVSTMKAICTIHKGSYDVSNLAYKALLDYANSKNLNLKTPSREVYLKGPGMVFRGNENNYLTEIMIPYENK